MHFYEHLRANRLNSFADPPAAGNLNIAGHGKYLLNPSGVGYLLKKAKSDDHIIR
jgi:hypothetical protein